MSAAIAFRGWAPEAGPEVGVSMSIGSVIPGVCCCWALGDDEWRMKNLRIAKSQGRPNRQLASDMGCDRGNLTRCSAMGLRPCHITSSTHLST